MNPYITEVMLRERHKEMVQEAERLRLVAAYENHTQTKKAQILAALGEKLVWAGKKLQQRYGSRDEMPIAYR